MKLKPCRKELIILAIVLLVAAFPSLLTKPLAWLGTKFGEEMAPRLTEGAKIRP